MSACRARTADQHPDAAVLDRHDACRDHGLQRREHQGAQQQQREPDAAREGLQTSSTVVWKAGEKSVADAAYASFLASVTVFMRHF